MIRAIAGLATQLVLAERPVVWERVLVSQDKAIATALASTCKAIEAIAGLAEPYAPTASYVWVESADSTVPQVKANATERVSIYKMTRPIAAPAERFVPTARSASQGFAGVQAIKPNATAFA